MFTTTRRKLFALATVIAVAITTVVVGALPAQATGGLYYVNRDSYSVQNGEPISIQQGLAACPSGTYTLQSVVIDSTSHTFIETIGTTASNGTWTPKWLSVDPQASLGTAQISIRCTSGGLTVLESDTRNFEVVPQTEGTVATKSYSTGSITIKNPPSVPCYYGGGGSLVVYGTPQTPGGDPTQTIETKSITPDSNGDFAVTLSLTSPKYQAGGDYYVIWDCWSSGFTANSWNHDAYHFTPTYYDYVALGDSYSSGEGSGTYDVTGIGPNCHDSSDSYPYYVASATSYSTPNLVACSGAVTDDLWRHSETLPTINSQFDSLAADTQLVTLTIGGNDIGFKDVANECTNHIGNIGWSCGTNTSMTSALDTRMGDLSGSSVATSASPEGRDIHPISEVITAIHGKAPNAKIYIAGYPHLFGGSSANYTADGNAPGGYKCVVYSGAVQASVSLWDAQYLNNEADILNGIISTAVANAPSSDSQLGSQPVPGNAGWTPAPAVGVPS